MSGAKHSVKVLKQDPDRRFVELEVDGKKVRVEKFTEEDWSELHEREKKENLSTKLISIDFIPFEEEEKREDSKVVFQRMALAAYRLLWYFGPPLPVFYTTQCSVYTFSLKYKGYIFKVGDDLQLRWLKINSVHLVPKGEEFDKNKYILPKEIREEITSIVEHLAMTPAEMYAGDYMVPV
ncbi:MAG: hypothetical protein FGF48_10515 [Candidatus Brockarchaeota archaeon]|nr:hypothetical protein [Candidatus Brockarchaeota archaeon]